MMGKKIVYKIKDISQIYSGGDKPDVFSEEKTEEFSVPVYSNGLDNEGLYGYTNKSQIEGDCITVSARGVNIGTVFYRKEPFLPIVRLLSVIPDRTIIDAKYLYYYFKTDKIIGTGSAQPQLTIPFFSKKKIYVYKDLSTQQKIASILATYDNLIQNYKKQIEDLQTCASELYKEWFVRLRFPGYQTTQFENGIPVGWKVERIGELYDTTSGGTPSREHDEYYQNGIYPWIKTGELNDSPIIETEEKIIADAVKHSSAKLFEKDSLIIAMYGATIGQLGINKMPATCNQACCVLRPKKNRAFGIYYLFNFFKENREFIIGLGNGAAQQNLSQILIKKLKIVNPPKEILESFENKESVFFERIYTLQKQITNLIQQRDLLLPRLMSGKLEVE